MALLLHIDTATTYGAVALSEDEDIIDSLENTDQKEHASFLHPAVNSVVKGSNKLLHQVDAITVTIGPGSYTGLRVGLAAAKGLCYALKKPLITVNTLQAIALAAAGTVPAADHANAILYAPMIDARRMEVFTALYQPDNELYSPPQALIINEEIFAAEMEKYFIVFAGDGSKKIRNVLPGGNFMISETLHTIRQVASIGYQRFNKGIIEDIAYCEPFYIKPFFLPNFVKN